MMARIHHLLLCVSVAVLLVTPCCAARSLGTAGNRGLLTSTTAFEEDSDVLRNDSDEGVPTSAALEKENEFKEWARFQAKEVSIDYIPAGANPDPGNPSPIGD